MEYRDMTVEANWLKLTTLSYVAKSTFIHNPIPSKRAFINNIIPKKQLKLEYAKPGCNATLEFFVSLMNHYINKKFN